MPRYLSAKQALEDFAPLNQQQREVKEFLSKRIAELEAALSTALEGWDEAAQYKSDYLREKHGDLEEIAQLKALLPEPPDA